MIIMTPCGLYCPAGKFYIDPSRAVEHAVITHAHSDHARRGSQNYYCETSGEALLKERLGQKIKTQTYNYRETFSLGAVQVSFHSAGHILGSAQVRIEYQGEVWVASGDYKRDFDPTCEPFEVVPCDVFITEATFGAPSFQWEKDLDLGLQISDWWKSNRAHGINSVLFAYSLGKAQRVLGVLAPHADRSIYCHPAATKLTECYRQQGVKLAATKCLSEVESTRLLTGELFLVPQSFLKTEAVSILGAQYKTAFASGWMAGGLNGYRFNYDHGFVMSDHADWNDLVKTIQQTQAQKVFVQHRGRGALVRHLKALGIKAYPDSDLFPKNPQQMTFF